MDSSEHDTFPATIHGILQNREEAEDVVQDTLVKAWKTRWRVRDPEKFPAWRETRIPQEQAASSSHPASLAECICA
jgi:hypothetical protein